MKRAIVLTLALGLAATACAGGRTVGGGLDDPGTEIAESKDPKPKKNNNRNKNNEPKVVETEEPDEPTVKVNTIIIAVRDNFEGFEYKQPNTKWKPATDGGPAVFIGDIIIFKNMDKQGFRHGWANEAVAGFKAGELWDSGALDKGEQFRFDTSVLDPGQYPYKDSVVPYRAAQGPMDVQVRPA